MTRADSRSLTDPAAGRNVAVERVVAAHEAVVTEFFRREWGGESEGGGAGGSTHFDASVPQWVCVRDGEAIGYLGSIPARFRIGGSEVDGHWLKGFWVREEYRSGPVGFMLLKKAVSELGLVSASVVALPARRLFGAMGLVERCALFNRVLMVRPARVLGRIDPVRLGGGAPGWAVMGLRVLQRTRATVLLGFVVDLALRIGRWLADRRADRWVARTGWDVAPEALDDLWARTRDQVHTTPTRDARAVLARYRDEGTYDLVTVWGGQRLEAWAIVRRPGGQSDPRLAGIRAVALSDILFPLEQRDLGVAAVRAAERVARESGADALVCSASHSALDAILKRRGYLSFPANVRIMARDAGGLAFGATGDDLWVTRGDGRADEIF